jgi:diadenosine tetraphosphatase ApaH/serine/threonine PP2A family protein phosphatase
MARLGIISDIHGNRVALEAVLREIDRRNVDALLCLGDIVGYGPEPRECLRLVRRTCRLVIRGNHEEAVVQNGPLLAMNAVARVGIEYTRKALDPSDIDFIRRLPASFTVSRTVLGVHDSPAPSEFGTRYLRSVGDAAEAFDWFEEPYCLVGHTHVPMCASTRIEAREGTVAPDDVEFGRFAEAEDGAVPLPQQGRSIINPGSVGQPRDRDPRASFAVLDLGRGLVEFARTEYDVAEAMRRAEEAGLPGVLGERLAIGA